MWLGGCYHRSGNLWFLPHNQLHSNLEVPSPTAPERVPFGACTEPAKLPGMSVVLCLSLASYELPPGQCLVRSCAQTPCASEASTCDGGSVCSRGMISKQPQLGLRLLLNQCLAHEHRLPGPELAVIPGGYFQLLSLWFSLLNPWLLRYFTCCYQFHGATKPS